MLTRIFAVLFVFLLSFVVLAVGQLPTFQARRAQAAQDRMKADALDRENATLPQVQAEVNAYRSRLVGAMGSVTGRTAPDVFSEETLTIGRRHHVEFDRGLLNGPLPHDARQRVALAAASPLPTPPPNIAPGEEAPTAPTPSPSATPVPGFYRAMATADDPLARRMVTFAGSTEIIGSYPDVIGALEDLSRGRALVSVISASICRDDHDTSGIRSLSVAFRLYGLSGENT